jgi:hypothetical protein
MDWCLLEMDVDLVGQYDILALLAYDDSVFWQMDELVHGRVTVGFGFDKWMVGLWSGSNE